MRIFSRLLIALALLSTGSLALAEQNHGQHDRRDSQRSSSHRGDQDNRGHGDRHRNDRRHDQRHDSDSRRYRHVPPRHYGHNYRQNDRHGYRYPAPHYVVRHDRWSRGHRYDGPNYVVSNYGYYRLRHPPRGYHWVRANNDYLLVAIATGVILDIALH